MSASRNMLMPASRLFTAASSSRSCSRSASAARALSTSSVQSAITKFTMPAMSPTMTSGGIAAWKVKEGDAFSAGDVLLEIETDKATMDVEAQEDGVLAKIVVHDGCKHVDVGSTIAMLAEEGDDISSVEVPNDDVAPAAAPQPSSHPPAASTGSTGSTGSAAPHTSGAASSNAHYHFKRPLFPSVQRLIAENAIDDAESKIKGTGVRGMITKGDVLAFLGKAKSPTGSFKQSQGGIAILGPSQSCRNPGAASAAASQTRLEPLTGDALRSLIIGGLASSSRSARQRAAAAPTRTLAAQTYAQQAVDSALDSAVDGYAFDSTAAAKRVQSGATRKHGIRSDDALWDLI